MMTYLVLLYYAFFIAVAAGLSLLRDREVKVDVLLHSTPLTPGEYVWGRFFAVLGGFVVLHGVAGRVPARSSTTSCRNAERDRDPRAVRLRELPRCPCS